MGRLNEWVIKHQGLALLAGAVVAVGSVLITVLTLLGFGPIQTPLDRIAENASMAKSAMDFTVRSDSIMMSRIGAMEVRYDAHVAASNEIHAYMQMGQRRSDIDLCLRYRDTPWPAFMQIDCGSILSGRVR